MNYMQSLSPEERRAIALKSHATRRANIEAGKKNAEALRQRPAQLLREIEELEAKLSRLRRTEVLDAVSAEITGAALLRAEEIVAASRPWTKASGVYFLVEGDEVVYVGQAVHVPTRIACHTDKRFSRYAFVPCPPEMLDRLESLYIHLLRPRLNGQRPDGGKMAPITLESLLGQQRLPA